jgi:hypothetical protein
MALIAENRYRVVEVLASNRRRMIDSDLSLMTAQSSIALFRQIDPNRRVVIELAETAEHDDAPGADVDNSWRGRNRWRGSQSIRF